MKNTMLIMLLLLIGIAQAQTLYLSNWFEVADGNIYGHQNPQITIVNDTVPIISWGRAGSSPAMFVSRWHQGFSTPLQITQNGQLPISSFIESPEFAVYGDTVFVVYADHGNVPGIFLHRSIDGGQSFSDTINVYRLPGYHLAFPAVATDAYGNPVVAFLKMEMNETDPYIFVCKSNDGGNSFSLPQDITSLNTGKPCECCPIDVVSSADTIVVTYRNNNNNLRDFHVAISYDNAQTFSTGARIDYTNFTILQCPTNGVKTIIQKDSLYAVWSSRVGSSYRVKKGAMNLSNLQIPPNNFVDNTVASNVNQSQCSFHGKNDTMAIVWHDNRFGSLDIFFSYSLNGFYDFSSPVLINNPSIGGSQQYPDVVYSNGIFHITYVDVFSKKIMYRQAGFNPLLGAPNICLQNDIQVFPNPFNEKITIKTSETTPYKAFIYDTRGLLQKNVLINENKTVLYLKELKAGVYILEIISENNIVHKIKIVKTG